MAYFKKARCAAGKATVSQVNAGLVIIPPEPGRTVRVVDAHLRAIGGTVTAATSVDLQASTTGTVILTGTPGNMTVAAGIVRAGATGMAVDAGWNTDLPVSEGVKLTKVGSDITTATHIEYVVTYVRS